MHRHANGPEGYYSAPKAGFRPRELKAIIAQAMLVAPDNPGRQDNSQGKLQKKRKNLAQSVLNPCNPGGDPAGLVTTSPDEKYLGRPAPPRRSVRHWAARDLGGPW